jgi:nitroreductase
VPLTPDELLTTTRAVRRRLDLTRPVPLQLVREALEIALQAPSGSNRQHWEWIVVTDPERRAALGDYYRQGWSEYRASPSWAGGSNSGGSAGSDGSGEEAPEDRVRARIGDSSTYLAEHMGDVPVLVLPCLRLAAGALPPGNQAGVWGSLLPAVWSYCLAARARGLGTAWTTLHLAREAEVAELLGLPDGVAQGALIPTAYYTGDTFRPAARNPLDEVLHLNRW